MAGFLAGYRGNIGTQDVVIIHDEGSQDETRTEAEAHIQARKGLFEVETKIYEGDIVELDDPRGGRERRRVTDVKIHQATRGHQGMNHITVTFGKAAPPCSAPIRRLQLENLHPQVIAAASDLFNDQHYGAAVAEAFKSIEVRVRNLTAIHNKSGA